MLPNTEDLVNIWVHYCIILLLIKHDWDKHFEHNHDIFNPFENLLIKLLTCTYQVNDEANNIFLILMFLLCLLYRAIYNNFLM